MSGAEARLNELGIELPGLQPAVGNYLTAKGDGDLLFVSGHGPIRLEPNGLVVGTSTREISVQELSARSSRAR